MRSPDRYIHHTTGTAFTAFHIDVLAELPALTTCARFTFSDTSVGLMVMLAERSDVRHRIRLRGERSVATRGGRSYVCRKRAIVALSTIMVPTMGRALAAIHYAPRIPFTPSRVGTPSPTPLIQVWMRR